MTDNSTYIELLFSKDKVNHFILSQLQDYSHEKLMSEDYQISFSEFKIERISRSEEKGDFVCTLETGLDFQKSAGIFSVQASGSLLVKLNISVVIDNQLGIGLTSNILEHSWLESPVLQMGSLDIEIEKLSDCAIQYLGNVVLKRLDKKISESLNTRGLLDEMLKRQCTNHLLAADPELFLNICPLQIQLSDIREKDEAFAFDFWVEFAIKLTSEPLLLSNVCNPSFFWLDNPPSGSNQVIESEFSAHFLHQLLIKKINGIELGGKKFEFKETSLLLHNGSIQFTSALLSPVQGEISIRFVPEVDIAKESLKIRDLQIEIKPVNILYKLTAPIIEKLLTQWILSQLPLDIKPYFKMLRDKLPVLSLAGQSVKVISDFSAGKINSFSISKQHIHLSVLFSNPSVLVTG